ncbi:MAG TPA: TIGR02449 family protein [Rudaea sp.]|jgi:cell division protein ZapB|nr:TIGR02449 family protein [Rudaea sp.]HTI97099.1 TIGR02449 family protein [Rudaea sp.]HZW52327.1 TIGR02449 family protein [Rudaea sp.]
MSNANPALNELHEVSGRIDRLLELCRRLAEENRSLRQSQDQLASERSNLLAKNEQARTRVEAMIARLRSLENGA